MCFAFPSAHSRLSRQRSGDYMQLKKDQFAIPRRPCPSNRGGAHGNCPCLCRLSLEIRLAPTSFDCAVAAGGTFAAQHDIPIVSEIAGLAATQYEWSM
jgi:hypothetical protein